MLVGNGFFNQADWNEQIETLFPQVFCIFLFLCAASLFGTIIAQVNEIVADLTTKKKELDRILEAYLVLNPRSVSAQDTALNSIQTSWPIDEYTW